MLKESLEEKNKINKCYEILKLYYDAFKGDLLWGVIHNISTPLQNIRFALDFVKKDLDITYLNLVEGELSRVFDVLEDFKNIEIFLAERHNNFTFEEVFALISKVLRSDLFFKHHVSLTIDMRENPFLPFHPQEFVLIFIELVRNALTALRFVDAPRELIFSVWTDPSSLIFGVGDNGCGWSDETEVMSFFEPGFRNWPEGKHLDYEVGISLGMGLYCVKKLLEKHNSRVELVRSKGISWAYVNVPLE